MLPAALAAGIVLQRLWPGDFDYGLRHGGPAAATWIALVGGALALVAGSDPAPRACASTTRSARPRPRCFVLPVFVHGLWHWSPRERADPLALSPRLVHRLRTVVPKGAVVLAPVKTSYRVDARRRRSTSSPRRSRTSRTRRRTTRTAARAAVRHWVLTNDPRVARRYGATWAIRNGRLYRLPQ